MQIELHTSQLIVAI